MNAQLREVINTQGVQIEALTGQIEALSAQLAAQVTRVAEMERRLGSDSSTSSKPPSSDPPYRKPERRSSRTASGRRPGKQPGTGGSTMPLVDNPNETIVRDVDRCGGCGADLTGAPVSQVERRQVTDITAPPPPYVTEYRILTRTCPCCASAQAGATPDGVGARAQYGPGVLAAAAELTCAHYLPVGRAAALLATLAGIRSRSGSSPVSVAEPPACSNRPSCPGCETCSGRWGCSMSTRPPPAPTRAWAMCTSPRQSG